jgi:hypothetical protein
VAAYKECGYDFVVFTDHERVTETAEAGGQDVLVMSGVEVGAGATEMGSRYHIVGVGLTQPLPEDLDRSAAQVVIDWLRDAGALVLIAHPYWTMLTLKDLLSLERYDGIEVFNAGCEWETRHGDASQHWDWLIERGRQVLGYAVDDSHWGFADYAGGWVMVRAEERSRRGIVNALRTGSFYSSAGPLINELWLDEEVLYLQCSPVRAVHMIMPMAGRGWTTHHLCKRPPCREYFTEVGLPRPKAGETFRIELVDAAGRKAWTNPMTVGEEDVQ